jgi:hypothetical protein
MISGCRSSDCSASSPSGVGASSVVPTIQSFALGPEPSGGPGTVQPSSGSPSASNDVEPGPEDTTMSSTNTPSSCRTSSLA